MNSKNSSNEGTIGYFLGLTNLEILQEIVMTVGYLRALLIKWKYLACDMLPYQIDTAEFHIIPKFWNTWP